jgi:MFS family permease
VASDSSRLFAAQGARAFAYGLGAVLLGTVLEERGWSSGRAALFFAAVLAGTVAANLVVGAYADRWGRRRTYAGLCGLLAIAGIVLASSDAAWPIVLVALSGALSTDVIESGPFTTLEQSMLGTRSAGRELVTGLGRYNAIAAAAGSGGALLVGVPGWTRERLGWGPTDQQLFLAFTVAGVVALVVTRGLSAAVEAGAPDAARPDVGQPQRRRSIRRLAALFSLDSFGGGFVAQSYIAFYLAHRFDASPAAVGATFAVLGVLSTASFLLAPRLAARIGLLETMVVTHVPSSVCLAAVVVAPNLPAALACLAGRALLSQMDVPTRQAYIVAIAGPADRSRAIATTNTARYLTRPLGAVAAGGAASVAIGAPLVLAAAIKVTYDAAVWRAFRGVPVAEEAQP